MMSFLLLQVSFYPETASIGGTVLSLVRCVWGGNKVVSWDSGKPALFFRKICDRRVIIRWCVSQFWWHSFCHGVINMDWWCLVCTGTKQQSKASFGRNHWQWQLTISLHISKLAKAVEFKIKCMYKLTCSRYVWAFNTCMYTTGDLSPFPCHLWSVVCCHRFW